MDIFQQSKHKTNFLNIQSVQRAFFNPNQETAMRLFLLKILRQVMP